MVSIIIPAYNYGRFIGETLKSVAEQTFTDWECLVIDNGSTDNTEEVVRSFLQDKRFVYIKQENKGVSNARNIGLKQAAGEYIQFLDADDLLEKRKLEESVAYLVKNESVDLVYTDMRYFRSEKKDQLFFGYSCDPNNDNPWMSYVSGKGTEITSVFLNGNAMVISSPLFKKSIIAETGLFDETIQHNEDWDLWLRFLLAGKSMHYLYAPETRTLIRIHRKSASVNIFKMQACGLKVLMKNSAAIKKMDLWGLLKTRIEDHCKGLKKSLAKSDAGTFKERISAMQRMGIYPVVFDSEPGNLTLMRLNLKLKSLFS